MVWFNVDDSLDGHPKVRKAGLEAMGFWVICGSFSAKYLTEGFIPEWKVADQKGGRKLAQKLVEAGLWFEAEQDGERGWRFHQWSQRNRTKAQVEADMQRNRERQQRFRDGKRNAVTNTVTEDESNAVTNTVTDSPRNAVTNAVTNPVSNGALAVSKPLKEKAPRARPRTREATSEADFEEFWSVYPRRQDKGHARTAWTKATKKTDAPAIVQAAQTFAQLCRGTEDRFIPLAATWLNGERWTDEPISPNGQHPQPGDPTYDPSKAWMYDA